MVVAGVVGVAACGSSAKSPADTGTTPITTSPASTARGGNGY